MTSFYDRHADWVEIAHWFTDVAVPRLGGFPFEQPHAAVAWFWFLLKYTVVGREKMDDDVINRRDLGDLFLKLSDEHSFPS